MKQLSSSMNHISNSAKLLLQRSANKHVRLGVTGLSGAGKTAFITGLVYQLLNLVDKKDNLPLLQAARTQRIIGVKRVMQPDLSIASFDYNAAISSLENTIPQWPTSTKTISELRLAIKYRPERGLLSNFTDTATLYLDIVDYPGEWLLDLPMLNQSFMAWCQMQHNNIEVFSSSTYYSAFINALQSIRFDSTADEQELKHIADIYQKLINDLVRHHGFYDVQPGRMLLPGELADTPLLTFFPILSKNPDLFERLEKSKKNSFYHVLNARYTEYVNKVIRPFYKDYFANFDRQLVLVDCLTALNNGKSQFENMCLALTNINESFKFGKNNLFKRLFSPRIDKLLFAATKIDHVTRSEQANVLSLLNRMLMQSQQFARFDGCQVESMVISAIKSTRYACVKSNNDDIEVVQGRTLKNGELIRIFPGEVPKKLPTADFWQHQGFDFCAFQPPMKNECDNEIYPHIRLDHVIEYLIGDKLQ